MSPEPLQVAELYDRKAAEYDAHYERRTDHAEDRTLYGWLEPLTRDKRVLDVGCGTALAVEHLAPWSYVGTDLSGEMLRRAELRIARVRGRRSRYRLTWPLDWCGISEPLFFHEFEGEFDTAFSLWAFPHFWDHATALNRMMRAVVPGGHVVVQGFAARYARRPNYILNGHGADLLTPTTPSGLRASAEQAGLEVLRVRGFRHRLDRPFMELLPVAVLTAGMRATSAMLPAAVAATHVLVARRPA